VIRCYNSYGEEAHVEAKETLSFKLSSMIYVVRVQLANIRLYSPPYSLTK